MEEYLVAMSQRTGEGFHKYWISISAAVNELDKDISKIKNKIISEGAGPLLGWPNNFTWRIFIVFTIYISTIVTILMYTELCSLVVLIIIQHACTIFFLADFLFAVVHRITYLPGKSYFCIRKYKWLVVEAVSLLPLSTAYVIIQPNYEREVVFWLSSVIFLRLYRIPQFFSSESNSAGAPHLWLTLLEYTMYLFLSLFTFNTLWMLSNPTYDGLEVREWNTTRENQFWVAMYFSFMTFTNTGFGEVHPTTTYEKIISTVAMLTGFALTSAILVGALTTHLLHREKDREKFRREFESAVKMLKTDKVPRKKQLRLLNEINMLWKYKHGISDPRTIDLFPIPLRKEIYFDVTFALLSRSLIFSVQERSFLRSISLAMKNKTYLPGDEIIHPSGIFRGMICVASGVIEILSRENDDSPLISFTSGTVLGEISLFMAIPTKTIIRAATIVELQVLDVVDFYRLILNYPNNYKSMREEMLRRYKEILKADPEPVTNTLHPEEGVQPKQKVLRFLIDELKHGNVTEKEATSSQNIFKSNILNLYVLIENLPRVKTLPINLIKDRPWILRPDTPLTNVWSKFMFITVTTVIYAYPYITAFVRKIDKTTFSLLLLIQIIYMVDVFLQCITAIPRGDLISYKTSIKEILANKLKSYGFYLDVISAYEFGVFSTLMNFGTEDYTRLLLSQNKLLKMWIIPGFFRKMENELSNNLLVLRIVKYFYYTTALIHIGSAVLYLEACASSECYPDRWFSNQQAKEAARMETRPFTEHPYVLSLYLALMTTSTAGFGNIVASCITDVYMIIFLMIMGLIIFNYCVAGLSVTYKHKDRRRIEYQGEIFAIDRFLVEHNLPKNLKQRVRNYFQVQWAYDRGASLKQNIPLEQLPRKQKEMMLAERLKTLKAVPIFKGANPGFMLVLAKGCTVRVLPENEMVLYAGGLDKEMYILQDGYCKITEKQKESAYQIIGPLTSFGDLEMVQGVPVNYNVKTLTHARIICIEYSTYLRGVTKYPDVRRGIETLMETQKPKGNTIFPGARYEQSEEKQTRHKKNWCKMLLTAISNSVINVYNEDKKFGRNYWEPFQAWNKFSFFKYMFLPFVIKPNSVLLHIWTYLRIISSLIMGFIAPIYFGLAPFAPKLKGIIINLQIITWLDVYMSFHIGYYDKRGILLFHPAKTVLHYLRTNFLIDFILVFPFFWVLEAIFHPSSPNLLYNGPGFIKVLQFYIFLQASNYLETDILKRTSTIKLLKYLPTVLIITNLATGLLLLVECHLLDPSEKAPNDTSTMSNFRRNIIRHCTSKPNLSSDHEWKNNIGDFDMYLVAFYWLTAAMTTCGFGDVVATDEVTMIICIFIVILGVFLYGCMFASIASSNIFSHLVLTEYRTKMIEMMVFLKKENVNKKMRKRFFKHYLHNWDRTLGRAPQKMLSQIHTALKQDIFDRMYENTLRKVSVFRFMDKSFMRSIGKYIDEIYFLAGETIVKHNHIQKDLYIIYRGKIDILGRDGKILTSMGDGGIFGNMTEKPFSLSSITANAATKVELIRLSSEDFHKTLMNYPAIRERIASLTVENRDYILPFSQTLFLSLDDFEVDIDPENDYNRKAALGNISATSTPSASSIEVVQTSRFYFQKAIYMPPMGPTLDFIVLSDSWLASFIVLLSALLSYINCFLTSYIFAFQDFKFSLLIPYLVMDLFFLFKIFMEFHYTYFDSHGDRIYHKQAIRKRYVSSKNFYIDIAANFPLDVFAVAAPSSLRFMALSFLRLNRLLRYYYIYQYYKRQTNRLVGNFNLIRIGILFTWITSMIHIFACIWYMAACPIFFCNKNSWLAALSMGDVGKNEIYVTSIYYVVTLITTTGYGDVVPVTRYEIFISTLMMITSHFAMVLGSVSFLSMMSVHTLNFVLYEERISQLRKDLKRQKISRYQLNKLWKYVQLLWWRESGKQIPQFINSAPYIMKCDVYNAMYGKHLTQSFIFSDLDDTFIRQLTIYMVRYVFFPGNYIVQQGDNDGTMYFIHRGEVSVMTIHLDLMETIHCSVRDNDQFGISQGLILSQPHQFSYRAETEVEILSLTLGHWQHLFKYFPEMKRIIYDRLEKIL